MPNLAISFIFVVFVNILNTYGQVEVNTDTLVSEIKEIALISKASSANISELLKLLPKLVKRLENVEAKLQIFETAPKHYNCTYTPYLVVCVSFVFGLALILLQSLLNHFQQMFTFRSQQKFLTQQLYSKLDRVSYQAETINSVRLPEFRRE